MHINRSAPHLGFLIFGFHFPGIHSFRFRTKCMQPRSVLAIKSGQKGHGTVMTLSN